MKKHLLEEQHCSSHPIALMSPIVILGLKLLQIRVCLVGAIVCHI